MSAAVHWIYAGLKESAAMVWMTWWPLVLGFSLSGAVQSFLPRDGLRRRLGQSGPAGVARASLLGVISSSCSYAASAMSRALFARGASWSNAVIFMVASTNLVIELGVVLYLLLGWQFVVAQIAGGIVMIAGLAVSTRLFFSRPYQARLRERVEADAPPSATVSPGWRQRLRERDSYGLAAQYTIGDLAMLRKELLAGFLVAGFLIVHVPATWWSHLFLSGHGSLTLVENVVVAPLLAVLSFVCSVGNIPLAGALWYHGVAFGGVVSFIFADLVTLPLLLIYRRFYGAGAARRLFALLWLVMSGAGLLVDLVFRGAHLLPTSRHNAGLSGQFSLGATLVLNVIATLFLAWLWWMSRHGSRQARDPVCGMTVDVTAPGATRRHNGHDHFFCSPRCAQIFDEATKASPIDGDGPPVPVDPSPV